MGRLQLPSGTVIEVELAEELEGQVSCYLFGCVTVCCAQHALYGIIWLQGSGQKKCSVFYILDVLSVSHEVCGDMSFKER